MSFNVNKCHVLLVGTRNQKFEYENLMNDIKLESAQYVKELGVAIASNLKFFQQCKNFASKANEMLCFINKNLTFKNKDVIIFVALRWTVSSYAIFFAWRDGGWPKIARRIADGV